MTIVAILFIGQRYTDTMGEISALSQPESNPKGESSCN